MPTLTVRDIPEDLYERLRDWAGSRRRSMSAEVVNMIEQALNPQVIDAEALIAEAKELYRFMPEPLPDLIEAGKHEGRR